ncbi:MAG: hypothetical protein EPN22_12450 [Nitrospirae bacterium]|nr:MAG: hypothetical protein EPN22_12450 [Nitrospirota bacterium]
MFEIPQDISKKAYQLIIQRLDGDRIDDREYADRMHGLVEKGIGGFIIFGGEMEAIKKFVAELQAVSEIPLFIASDIERGVAQQIRGGSVFPSQMAVAAAIDRNSPEDVKLLEQGLKAVAAEAAYIGINMPLIPVLDVNLNPDNPIICTRAFSDRPETVSWFGLKYISALEGAGLISCAKHFPGHGDTSVDSHIDLPVIKKAASELRTADFLPFTEAIKAGVKSIMMAHLTLRSLDFMPTSLSRRVITGLLRKELGFEGLVLTDALNMHALKDFGNVPVECLEAGTDILLHPEDPDSTANEVISAILSEKLDEKKIDESLSRILKAKKGLAIIPNISKKTDCEIISSKLSEAAATLLKGTADEIKLPDDTEIFFAGDEKFFEHSPLKHIYKTISADELNKASAKTVLFAVFTSIAAWRGSSGISEDESAKLNQLIKNCGRSIVVSFGSPYVLKHFEGADFLIAVYDSSLNAQLAVAACLRGDAPFRGRLPVSI